MGREGTWNSHRAEDACSYVAAGKSILHVFQTLVCMYGTIYQRDNEQYKAKGYRQHRLEAILGLWFWNYRKSCSLSSANLSQSRSSPVFTYILCISQPSSTSVTNTHTQLSKKTAVKPRLNLSLSPI